mmetsp:Transcript_74075/g.197490  ORF Transcript_74075/g.197490 Transcript_74075/m.197490 type:complete len:233 (+) Transcript_74075:124-822(+)
MFLLLGQRIDLPPQRSLCGLVGLPYRLRVIGDHGRHLGLPQPGLQVVGVDEPLLQLILQSAPFQLQLLQSIVRRSNLFLHLSMVGVLFQIILLQSVHRITALAQPHLHAAHALAGPDQLVAQQLILGLQQTHHRLQLRRAALRLLTVAASLHVCEGLLHVHQRLLHRGLARRCIAIAHSKPDSRSPLATTPVLQGPRCCRQANPSPHKRPRGVCRLHRGRATRNWEETQQKF